jgi:hypothetical protein
VARPSCLVSRAGRPCHIFNSYCLTREPLAIILAPNLLLIMSINLSGVLLPVTTPFAANENFDPKALVSNLSNWNDTGIVGYVLLRLIPASASIWMKANTSKVIEEARAAVPKRSLLSWGGTTEYSRHRERNRAGRGRRR